jgi:hypothetical protein
VPTALQPLGLPGEGSVDRVEAAHASSRPIIEPLLRSFSPDYVAGQHPLAACQSSHTPSW